MLPSFRLIGATFLCGFFVVFAGLRLAASLNDIHEGLPVMAAHAAPVAIAPVADREARRGLAAVPMMYDLRFAVSTVAPTLIRLPPTVLDRPAPPLSIVPPEDVAKEALEAEPAKEPAEPEATVSAIEPQAPVAAESAVIQDAPAGPPAPKAPAIAAIDSQAKPNAPAGWPAAETPAPATQAAAIEPRAAPSPGTEEPLANSEPAAEAPADPATGPDPEPGSPAAMVPKPQAAKSSPRARTRIAGRKHIRIASRVAPTNPFGNAPGSAQR